MSALQPPVSKRVLLIAFHFPPFGQSSGLLRTFCFACDLLQHGWIARVLTVDPRVYEKSRGGLEERLPGEVAVERARAWDTARDFAIAGRYPGWLALPDRWWSWAPSALWLALRRWRDWRPHAIWSTYPIATAHLIGLALARATGVPWIADFRDPMVEQDERTGKWIPGNSRLRGLRLWIERACVSHATRLVFCTAGARDICLARYGARHADKCVVIANGYDEDIFAEVEQMRAARGEQPATARTTLLHSGVIYASADRDPSAFIAALGALKRAGEISAGSLRVILRASGNEVRFTEIARQHDCTDIVEFPAALPYHDAIAEMFDADGLLIFQGYPSNPAIPAKLYEYVRTGRPVFAMAHAAGETARLVQSAELGTVVDLEDSTAIADALRDFLAALREGRMHGASAATIRHYARSERAAELAAVLDTLPA